MRLISPKPDSTGTYEHEIQLSSVQGIKQTEATGKKELDLCTCLPSEQLVVDQIFVSLILTASLVFRVTHRKIYTQNVALSFMSAILRY